MRIWIIVLCALLILISLNGMRLTSRREWLPWLPYIDGLSLISSVLGILGDKPDVLIQYASHGYGEYLEGLWISGFDGIY